MHPVRKPNATVVFSLWTAPMALPFSAIKRSTHQFGRHRWHSTQRFAVSCCTVRCATLNVEFVKVSTHHRRRVRADDDERSPRNCYNAVRGNTFEPPYQYERHTLATAQHILRCLSDRLYVMAKNMGYDWHPVDDVVKSNGAVRHGWGQHFFAEGYSRSRREP